MRSSLLSRMRNSLGLRLTVWYAVSFVVISSALSVISYVHLSTAVRDTRNIIQARLNEITAIARQQGVDAIRPYVSSKYSKSNLNAVVVRVFDQNGVVSFQSNPEIWEEFRSASRTFAVAGAWQYVPSSQDRDVLELATVGLPGGYLLQVGKEIQDRKEILEHYRETIIGVTSGMILIGLAGGMFLVFRALRPVRDLTRTTHSIIATGNVAARVAETSAGDEIEELARLFNRMLERIENLINGMRDALDNVAHDLRTPMARLRGVAELALQAEQRPEQHRDALVSCIEESDRILALLNCLMDISEAETGAMRLNLETIALSSLIRETVELYEYLAEEKHIALAVNCSPDAQVTADRARMRQVVGNLLDNAIKYSERGGTVSITVSRQQTEVSIAVRDDGCGISPEEKPHIWDRLHRGDASRSQPGLGLGLSLVRAIVKAHNGCVDVQSAPGQGAVFNVSFPINTVRA